MGDDSTEVNANSSCDYGMIQGTNGRCYYPPNEDWNW